MGGTQTFSYEASRNSPGAAFVEDAEKGIQETEGVKNYL